jgi:4-amino-4-deoxy-L-arabinose transferase-like glycosyltransferase
MKSPMHARITQHRVKRAMTVEPTPSWRERRIMTLLLVLILLGALGLRVAGLSHGLSRGEVYHPDTPRLMWASRVFLEGTYFFRMDNLDYDGYPYFYSHVVEYFWRGIRGVSSFFSYLVLGADRGTDPPSPKQLGIILFWLARLTNVMLSTLAVFVVYRIAARQFDRTTGLIAAGLLAISPMNIAMAHFATNDAMVCFFTTLTVLFALRIYVSGRWIDYLLSGVLVACSFSAKYHGGFVGLTCLLAHILRLGTFKKVLSKEALSNVLLMGVSFFVTFLLTNPCFLVSPSKAFHDFRQFCRYIPTARLTESQLEMGFFAKMGLSISLNFPILVRSLGVVTCVIAFAGLIHAFFQGKKLIVLASFPSLYLLLTFLSKPVQQRFYLAAFFPILFLLGAGFLVKLARIKKIQGVTTIAAILVVGASAFYLLKSSLTEVYFFRHSETRRCAKLWAIENIPPFYRMESGDYTFAWSPPDGQTEFQGTMTLSSSIRPLQPGRESFLLKAFDLEADALPFFRNPRVEILAPSTELLSKGFALPVYQRIPSLNDSDFIFEGGASFYRNEKCIELSADQRVSKTLVSGRAIDSAIVIVRNGDIPGSTAVQLGGVTKTFYLDSGGDRWKEFSGLQQSFPSDGDRHFYKLSAGTTLPRAQLIVATTDEEKGAALYNLAEYAAACPFLIRASQAKNAAVLAGMALVSSKVSGYPISSEEEKGLLEKASPLRGDLTPETVRSTCGIAIEYLDGLPYLSFKPQRESAKGFYSVEDISASADSAATLYPDPPDKEGWRIGTSPLLLEPGCYAATLRVRCDSPSGTDAKFKVCLVERSMRVVLAEKEFEADSVVGSYTDIKFPFEKPGEVAECRVLVRSDKHLPLFVDRIEVRPDPLGTLQALRRLLGLVLSPGESLPTAGPLDYRALVSLGRSSEVKGQYQQAVRYYLLAHDLRGDLAKPVRGLRSAAGGLLSPADRKEVEAVLARSEALREEIETHEASVVFKNGIRLRGYAIKRGAFRPGETVSMSFDWSVSRTERFPKDLIVWVHLLDKDGKKVLQLDHYLSEDLALPQTPTRLARILNHERRIPENVPEGSYRIEMGLWIPMRDWRPRVASTSLPHSRNSVTVGEIVVGPR